MRDKCGKGSDATPLTYENRQSENAITADPMEADTKERLSVRITGRVQGVGFRNFTQMRARQLGLTGWVRNESDGSVRLEAEGPRGALEELLEAIQEGPRMAFVEDIDAEWSGGEDEFDVFRVRR